MSATWASPLIFSFIEKANTVPELQQAHGYMLKTGIFHQTYAVSRLITSAAANTNTLSYAHSIFAQIHQPNTYIYNTMIRAYAASSPYLSVTLFLKLLCDEGDVDVFPDKYTFTFIFKACASLFSVEPTRQIHAHVLKQGLGCDSYICNTLLNTYAKCGRLETARFLLDRMPTKDVISWNALLSVLVDMGLMDLASGLFREMPTKNLESWNFLLSGYLNSGLLVKARKVFDNMLERDVVSWNAMLTGYAKAGMHREVWMLFEDMQRAELKPDSYTLVNLLSTSAVVGALNHGLWVHNYICRNGIEVKGFLATALVDMYSKCGNIEKAIEVFDRTSEKDVSTWNAMITGLSIHGRGKHALHLFSEMIDSGNFEPNEITFVSLLSACSRVGLFVEGQEIFESMVSVYGIEPSIEHYGCMVDLLGRFGLLEEAKELVEKMPVKQTPLLWESLLSACRNHGNTDLAEQIARKLLELDPEHSTGYLQLSNIQASTGRWNDVCEIRREMRAKEISKRPGGSLIEVDGIVHEFLAGEGIIY